MTSDDVIEFSRRRPPAPMSVSIDDDGRAYLCLLLREDVTLGRLARVLAAGGLAISNSRRCDSLVIHPQEQHPHVDR